MIRNGLSKWSSYEYESANFRHELIILNDCPIAEWNTQFRSTHRIVLEGHINRPIYIGRIRNMLLVKRFRFIVRFLKRTMNLFFSKARDDVRTFVCTYVYIHHILQSEAKHNE